ncbi:MAG: hypothetical protein OXM57_09075 [bacterium]|nr:hypothetical protein [bacterium]MDE0352833.1 hypothetical protein [bacterium]
MRMTAVDTARVTEPLVDAKDEARQAEVRTDIAQALLTIHKETTALVWRATAVIIAAFGITVTIILNVPL